jgi:hypothetical protein
MRRKAIHKVSRGVLMAAVLVVGLVTAPLDKSRRVEAVDCDLSLGCFDSFCFRFRPIKWCFIFYSKRLTQ